MAERRRVAFLAAALSVAAPIALAAQDWLGVHALFDVEAWRSAGRSTLLSRPEPRALLGRAFLFGVAAPRRGIELQIGMELEGATDEAEAEVELDHVALRFLPSPYASIEIGKFAQPVGTFAARRFSTSNPLIGRPDGYPVTYPLGAMVSGAVGRFDYRAALVSLPPTNTAYVPEPGHAIHPVVGAGVTPLIGLRIGASWTVGPYLSKDDEAALPTGTRWQDFQARVVAADLRFARGYLELFAELAASWYEVPNLANEVKGTTYYVEAKYTWSPRFFTAVRFERNLYAFIQNTGTSWRARATDFVDGEAGIGFRFSAHTLVKASYRKDDWDIQPGQEAFLGEGWAAALQISYWLDW
jgi:hypothetical protein